MFTRCTPTFIVLLSIFILPFTGCSMERVPASIQPIPSIPTYTFPSCSFHAFPEASTSLFPSIRLIDCEVEDDLEPEDVEFEFEHKGGEIFGKQSKKRIEEIRLETNEHGAIYYVNYEPKHGVQNSLGRWCCWNLDNTTVPTWNELLPDELRAVHVESDGGMVYRASWNFKTDPRGLAVILCGMGGMQHSSKVLGKTLLRDGWAVVYLYTIMNVPDYKLKVKLKGDTPASAAIDIFNKKYCQVIGATKAIRERMKKQIPSLQDAPLALIGISAGALNTPAVYHELQDEVDAVILVAGGANMFDIVQDGAFTNWKFTDDAGNAFSKNALLEINASYLATPSRDPYFLAPELPRNNTLLIHAKWDMVVPAASGDLLWERAGKPERWIYPSGHLGLFMAFEWHAEDIAQWLNSNIN